MRGNMGLADLLDKKHGGQWIRTGVESAYLCYLAFIVWYTYMLTTMFIIPWPSDMDTVLHRTGFILLLFKILMDKKWDWKDILFAIFLVIGCEGNWHYWKVRDVVFLEVLILGAHGVCFDKIVKTYLMVEIPSILITIYCSLHGYIAYLTYDIGNRQLSHAFGSVFRTDFSAHLFFLACGLVWISRKKIWYAESILILWLAWFVNRYCMARNSTICLLLLGFSSLFIQVCRDIRKQRHKQEVSVSSDNSEKGMPFALIRMLSFCLCFCMPLFAVATVLLSRFYDPGKAWMLRLNNLISNRLILGKTGFDQHNVTWFGEYVKQLGAGGLQGGVQEYFFLDISYVNMLLRLGVIIFASVIGIFVLSALRVYRNQDYVCILILALVALHCCIEHHLVDTSYDMFLLLLFADAGWKKNWPLHKRIKERS